MRWQTCLSFIRFGRGAFLTSQMLVNSDSNCIDWSLLRYVEFTFTLHLIFSIANYFSNIFYLLYVYLFSFL